MKEIITTNFGFAGFLIAVKKFPLQRIEKKDGIFIKIPDDTYLKDLKTEYNTSDFKLYNDTLREIISNFK